MSGKARGEAFSKLLDFLDGSAKDELSEKESEFRDRFPEGVKKVTIASPTEKGLQEGLSKAQQILKAKMGSKEGPSKKGSEDISEKLRKLKAQRE